MRLTLLAGHNNAMNMAVDGRRRRDDLICEAVAWQMTQQT